MNPAWVFFIWDGPNIKHRQPNEKEWMKFQSGFDEVGKEQESRGNPDSHREQGAISTLYISKMLFFILITTSYNLQARITFGL